MIRKEIISPWEICGAGIKEWSY